jgi:hypothetical protein
LNLKILSTSIGTPPAAAKNDILAKTKQTRKRSIFSKIQKVIDGSR